MTALDILRKHTTHKGLDIRQELFILDAMKEIYELGHDHGYTRACEFYVDETNTGPSLKERFKQLFPEK